MLSRIKLNTRPRMPLLLRNNTIILPHCRHSPTMRTFKTFTARLSEVPNPIAKPASTDIPVGQMTREQTAQLYLDNVFPLKFGAFDIRQLFFRDSKNFLESKAHQSIPSKELPHDFAIKEVIARTKDGGAIITFSFRSTDGSKIEVAKDIVERVNDYIAKNKIVAPFNLQSVRAFLVKGSPFLEDILARYPTQRIRIEFQGEAVNVENLYNHLRRYGKIFDIALYPNPMVAKDPSRYAIVQFTRVRAATSARNCLHGHYIDGTRLNILYERQLRTNIVKDWIVNHPRITVPVVAAIFAGITYVVFDPVREFFITSKVTQRFNPEEYKAYRWLRKETWARLVSSSSGKDIKPDSSVWADDAEKTGKLISWLAETPETFVLVTGHKGSGKSALVKSAIHDRKNKLFIDCEAIGNARNQSEMTKILAKQVGYFPVFTWATSMSGLIDTMVAATTGQKAGLSTTPDSQIKNILETVAIALRDIVPKEKEAKRKSEEENLNLWGRFVYFLQGKSVKVEIDDEKSNSEKKEEGDEKNIPIIVLENYMYRETAKNAKLWEELAEWASLLIENEIAHVIFVSSNAGVMKTLGKSLPGKSFSTIPLSDAPPEKAMSFIRKQLGSDVDDPNLHAVVSALGGRLTELELLVQKMKMDMDAETAFDDIVLRNLIEIRKYGFGDTATDDSSKPDWTSTQFWTIVKQLSKNISINYDELKWGPAFGGNDHALQAMERAELITIVQKEGRAHAIKPGKPVYYTVFHRLVTDAVFAASMEVESNTVLKKQSEEEINKLEGQIEKLNHMYLPNKPPKEVDARTRFLLNKIVNVQKAIEQYDANIKQAKETISKAWKEETH